MTAAKDKSLIAVATSIAPSLTRKDGDHPLPEYQALCVQSWIANGFRVISINDPEEIPALAQCHPEVTFVPTSRNAGQWTGRKNPYIADLLLALKDASEPVLGIINSDLIFEPSSTWVQRLPSLVESNMVVAHRYNANSLSEGALRRYDGLDCFFFDKTTALDALEDATPYAMGVPWLGFVASLRRVVEPARHCSGGASRHPASVSPGRLFARNLASICRFLCGSDDPPRR